MERPYGTQDRITAEDARRAAQLRARRAATVARRAAAGRRRRLLTGVLLVASVLAWVVVGLTAAPVATALVPTLLLAGLVGLGRRAVVSARRADAAWERQQQRLTGRVYAPAPRVTGRALHPSDSHTEAIAQVTGDAVPGGARPAAPTTAIATAADTAAQGVPSAATDGAATADAEPAPGPGAPAEDDEDDPAPAVDGAPVRPVAERPAGQPAEGWSPVPVPRPTYTTKAPAPRREPLPLVVDPPAAGGAASDLPTHVPTDRPSTDDVPAVDTTPAAPPVDLDAILARRRAAGE